MNHPTRLLPALAASVLASHCLSQVGWRHEAIPNPSSVGSPSLEARIFYPAFQAGQNAALRPTAGGYPVVVFMHGLNSLGRSYRDLGVRIADAGYIAVMADTPEQRHDLQRDNGWAMFHALTALSARAGTIWTDAFDMKRAAVGGHSMGAGSAVRILATNPGYRTGICFAPWHGAGAYPSTYAPQVQEPLLILHGEGDTVISWHSTAQAYYDHATAYADLKTFVLLGPTAITRTSCA